MPAHRNPLLSHFTERPRTRNAKYPILACKHCSWSRANSNQALKHLEDNCTGRPLQPAAFGLGSRSEPSVLRQQLLQLGVRTLSQAKKQKLDFAAALAVYISAQPFALFECCYMRRFIDILSDSLYKPPGRQAIGNGLLVEIYNNV
jgi:hypothetical protein